MCGKLVERRHSAVGRGYSAGGERMEKWEVLDAVKAYYKEHHKEKPYEKGDRICYAGGYLTKPNW